MCTVSLSNKIDDLTLALPQSIVNGSLTLVENSRVQILCSLVLNYILLTVEDRLDTVFEYSGHTKESDGLLLSSVNVSSVSSARSVRHRHHVHGFTLMSQVTSTSSRC